MNSDLKQKLISLTGKPLADCTDEQIYLALLELVRGESESRRRAVTGKKLYYISAEFLIGKLLSNNLINLGLYDDVRKILKEAGKDLSRIEEVEPEPALGNGGLGRLAACFLDSLATLNLPGDGIGLRYHFGLFRQDLSQGVQRELPDPWLTARSWAEPTDITFPVSLAGRQVNARLYRLAVTGYQGRTNTLNLFDLDTVDEGIVHDGIQFDKGDVEKCLTLFLYPDDSDEAGRLLRIYQQYLMVSAGAQLILAECRQRGSNLRDLADYAAIQINDTHPSMVIPELIRLLGQEGIGFEEAVQIVTDTCAYTNHTILAEALETWPWHYLEQVVPPADAHHPAAGRPGPHPHRRREPGGDRPLGQCAHGPHGHPLHPLHQRRGGPAHPDSGKYRAPRLLSALSRKIQQQDQRHHLPPLAAGVQPRADGGDPAPDRPRLQEGRRGAGKAHALRRRRHRRRRRAGTVCRHQGGATRRPWRTGWPAPRGYRSTAARCLTSRPSACMSTSVSS